MMMMMDTSGALQVIPQETSKFEVAAASWTVCNTTALASPA
jgi:hypothetical protein